MTPGDSWIGRARKALAYQEEVLDFLARVRSQVPTASPLHASAVTRLWLDADELDPLVCGLLQELNQGLLGGDGELDITRGASMPLSDPKGNPEDLALAVPSYACTWSLLWDAGRKRVSVVLAMNPGMETMGATVLARQSLARRDLSYPVAQAPLEAALTDVFVGEATVERLMAQLEGVADAMVEREAALQRAAGIDLEPREASSPSKSKRGRRRAPRDPG